MNKLNELTKKQIYDDYKEILSTEAGKRIVGGIFYKAGINTLGCRNEYYQGFRDLGLLIANTIRKIDPHLIADCEIAYEDFIRRFDDGRDNTDNDNDEYSDD